MAGVQVSITFDTELMHKMDFVAKKSFMTRQQFIRFCVEEHMKVHDLFTMAGGLLPKEENAQVQGQDHGRTGSGRFQREVVRTPISGMEI